VRLSFDLLLLFDFPMTFAIRGDRLAEAAMDNRCIDKPPRLHPTCSVFELGGNRIEQGSIETLAAQDTTASARSTAPRSNGPASLSMDQAACRRP